MPDSTDEHGFAELQDDLAASNPFESPSVSELPSTAEFSGIGYVSRREKPLNTLTSIWTKPRLTVRRVLDVDPRRHVFLITALSGASNALGSTAASLGNAPDIAVLLGMCLYGAAIGVAVAFLSLYIGSWVFTGVGRLLGGVGFTDELRTAIAYANIIAVWCIPLTLCAIVLSWIAVREPGSLDAARGLSVAIGLVLIACGIWQYVVLCCTVAEAHRFSTGKGFLTVLLPTVPVMAMAFLILWDAGIG